PRPAIRNFRAGDAMWSITRTVAPPFARTSAAMRPEGPAPMMSTRKLMRRLCHGRRIKARPSAAEAPGRRDFGIGYIGVIGSSRLAAQWLAHAMDATARL